MKAVKVDFDNMDVFGNKIVESIDENPYKPSIEKEFDNINLHYEEDKENQKEEEDIYRSNKILKEQELAWKQRQSVYQTSHSILLSSSAREELPKVSTFSYFADSIKRSIIGLSEEEADKLLRVDESQIELSNQDVILAKPGWLVKKDMES